MQSWPSQIQNRSDLREFLRLDLQANGIDRWRLYQCVTRPEVHYQRLMRRAEYASTLRGAKRIFYYAARVRLARQALRTGISIPPGVFGPGLSIPHFGSVVVNAQVRAGAFCRIHSATNLGDYGGTPRLGDFVYIGPGAVAFGPVSIGDRAVLAANSVTRRDVPTGFTSVGMDGRVVPKDSSRVMPPWIQVTLSDKESLGGSPCGS